MKSFKSVRNSEDIMRELTAILREMKDPRLHNSLISIVRVDVSSDVSYCKVYISSMSGMESAKEDNGSFYGIRSNVWFWNLQRQIRRLKANNYGCRQSAAYSL